MGFSARSGAFEPKRKGLEDGLIGGFEGIGQLPVGRAIASLDQLHHGNGRDSSCGDQLHHGLGITNIGILDVEARGLQGSEELLDGPPHPVKIYNYARLAVFVTS